MEASESLPDAEIQCSSCGCWLSFPLPGNCPRCDQPLRWAAEGGKLGARRSAGLRFLLARAAKWGERFHCYWLAAAFIAAVGQLFLLQGADLGIVLLFLIPPTLAFGILSNPAASNLTRALSYGFLALIGVGVVLGPQHDILPGMDGWKGQLPRTQSRILTWYTGVYLLYFLGILPPVTFGSSLRRRRRGEPPALAPDICYLGLFTWLLLIPGLAAVINLLMGR